jgi:hypothetical protein
MLLLFDYLERIQQRQSRAQGCAQLVGRGENIFGGDAAGDLAKGRRTNDAFGVSCAFEEFGYKVALAREKLDSRAAIWRLYCARNM